MRVKKLNVNRRHKPGEDETVSTGGGSEQRKWVSPTKPQRGAAASGGSSSGSSSPTDVNQQQQLLSGQLPLHFPTQNSPTFYSVGRPNAGAAGIVMHEETVDKLLLRKAMVDRIAETLRTMQPHAPDKVLAELPSLALHMEKALFKLAKNEAEYGDVTTLRMRIAEIQEHNFKRLLAQQQRPEQQTPEQGNCAAKVPLKLVTEEQTRIIFQHLQSWRQKLVNMCDVVPWDILPNSTLAKVALYVPATEQELSACGIGNEQISHFGSSLLQELQRLVAYKQPIPAIKAKQGHKPGVGKRELLKSSAVGTSKKHRKGEAARLAPAPSFDETSLIAPAPLLPAVDSLPTLHPSVSTIPRGVVGATTTLMAPSRLSPCQVSPQQSFFARLQPQPPPPQEPQPENHMHLLYPGAGQLSKQQNAKGLEAYEKEIHSLRWMLHQSQQEKSQLEIEVQRLRAELERSGR